MATNGSFFTLVCCQLIDKATGESYKTILQDSQNKSVVFDRVNDSELADIDITDYLLYVTYYHDWQWYEGYTDDDYNILGYYSYNYVYLVDIDENERTLYTTINGDDMMSISQRTFYNEDG